MFRRSSRSVLHAVHRSLLGAGRLWRHARTREAVIHEQVQFVEARHEELREAYPADQRSRA